MFVPYRNFTRTALVIIPLDLSHFSQIRLPVKKLCFGRLAGLEFLSQRSADLSNNGRFQIEA